MNEVTQADSNNALGGSQLASRRNYFESLAAAWGQALDKVADRLTTRADALIDGEESPRAITLLTAESLRMQFLSTSSHTGITSVGTALETLARKQ